MSFEFPSIYNFPPFFTRQPVEATRRKQLLLWGDLILNYCRANKIIETTVTEFGNSSLFENKKINRKVSRDFLNEILDCLVAQGNAEYTSKTKEQITLFWRKVDAWAKLIYNYAESTGQSNGSILTLYDLQEADETRNEEFHGLETEVLLRALKVLEKEGKAEVFSSGDGSIGVKFFKNKQAIQNQLWMSSIFNTLYDVGMVFAPSIGFIPQAYTMIKLKSSSGFSVKVCFIFFLGAVLRMGFWIGKRFNNYLMAQAILLAITQLIVCYYKAKEQLRKVHGVYSYFKFFWNWDNFFHYLIATIFIMVFIFSFARVTSAIPTIVELFGFFALAVESIVVLPQALHNAVTHTTCGLSNVTVCWWCFGDVLKFIWYTLRETPIQFYFCSVVQIVIDLWLACQCFLYREKSEIVSKEKEKVDDAETEKDLEAQKTNELREEKEKEFQEELINAIEEDFEARYDEALEKDSQTTKKAFKEDRLTSNGEGKVKTSASSEAATQAPKNQKINKKVGNDGKKKGKEKESKKLNEQNGKENIKTENGSNAEHGNDNKSELQTTSKNKEKTEDKEVSQKEHLNITSEDNKKDVERNEEEQKASNKSTETSSNKVTHPEQAHREDKHPNASSKKQSASNAPDKQSEAVPASKKTKKQKKAVKKSQQSQAPKKCPENADASSSNPDEQSEKAAIKVDEKKKNE